MNRAWGTCRVLLSGILFGRFHIFVTNVNKCEQTVKRILQTQKPAWITM